MMQVLEGTEIEEGSEEMEVCSEEMEGVSEDTEGGLDPIKMKCITEAKNTEYLIHKWLNMKKEST